jgi:hypothetical protein
LIYIRKIAVLLTPVLIALAVNSAVVPGKSIIVPAGISMLPVKVLAVVPVIEVNPSTAIIDEILAGGAEDIIVPILPSISN